MNVFGPTISSTLPGHVGEFQWWELSSLRIPNVLCINVTLLSEKELANDCRKDP